MQPNEDTELPKLVHMANQIAAFFRPYPADEAAASVRDHLAAFWTQPMRDKLQAADAAGLDPLVARALAPARGETPAGAA
jgi:formate dehydrogenase subunit delta